MQTQIECDKSWRCSHIYIYYYYKHSFIVVVVVVVVVVVLVVVVSYSIQLWHVQNCIQLIFATNITTMMKAEYEDHQPAPNKNW